MKTILTALAVALVVAIAPTPSADAGAQAPLMPAIGSELRKEAASYKTPRHIPMDERTRVTYLGATLKKLQNGRDVWSVRSKRNKDLWHSYRVVAK